MYIIFFKKGSPAIGIDAENVAKERSYVYNGGSLVPVKEYSIDGGMMIRAVMDYVEKIEDNKDNEDKYPIITRNIKLSESGEDILISFDLYNTTNSIINGVVIIKLIANNGREYRVISKPVEISTIYKNVELNLNKVDYKEGIKYVKVYVWDSLDNMKPLADVK